MITAEYDPPKESGRCPCCGGTSTRLTRFVYRDRDAYAVFLAQYSDNHPKRLVLATVSIGEWGDDASADQRLAFGLQLSATADQYQVTVLPERESPWRNESFLGRTLDREEALAHPRIAEIYEITDFLFAEDSSLKKYLDGGSNAA